MFEMERTRPPPKQLKHLALRLAQPRDANTLSSIGAQKHVRRTIYRRAYLGLIKASLVNSVVLTHLPRLL